MSFTDKTKSSPTVFNALATVGVAGVIGGLYYLFNLFSEEDLSEKEIIEIEEMKETIQKEDGKLTQDLAIKILFLTNHHAEEEMKKQYPHLDKKRREAMNNEEEYKAVCMECLEKKEQLYMHANTRILSEFNTTMEEIQKMLMGIDQNDMEKKFFQFEKPKFIKEKPGKTESKEAFIYYGNKLVEEMQGLANQARSMQYMQSPEAQQAMMFNFLTSKMKVEDMLYIKYSLSEQQIRFLLIDHDLHSDYQIQQMHSRIAAMEEMMG